MAKLKAKLNVPKDDRKMMATLAQKMTKPATGFVGYTVLGAIALILKHHFKGDKYVAPIARELKRISDEAIIEEEYRDE